MGLRKEGSIARGLDQQQTGARAKTALKSNNRSNKKSNENGGIAYFSPKVLLRPPLMRAAYSDRTAWIMAKAAELAYIRFEDGPGARAELEAALASGGFELTQTFDESGTQAYLACSPNMAILAFRGTEKNYRDIITDINIRFFEDSEGRRTHRGFSRAFERIADEVSDAVLGVDAKVPIYITGHSLGGALATIAAKLNPHDNVAACYTFGSPRVGSGDYDVHIKIPVYRVVNKSDVVSRIPWGVFGYTHVGDLRYINDGGLVLRAMQLGGGGIPFLLYTLFFQGPIRNHRIGEYIRALEKFAEGRMKDKTVQGRLGETLLEVAETVVEVGIEAAETVLSPVRGLTATANARLAAWLRRER